LAEKILGPHITPTATKSRTQAFTDVSQKSGGHAKKPTPH